METVVSLSDVSKWLGDKLVLDRVDWQVKRGEHWALLGLNGSGKTTLLRIASGHLWPSTGEVSLLGKKFGSVDLRQLRRSVGWVTSSLAARNPQGLTALETVLSGRFDSFGLFEEPSKADSQRALELLSFMECSEVAHRAFGVLSQGEQQRVLIARAMMPDPKLIILDEPCSGLDIKAREAFLKTVGRLTGKVSSVILVTHHVEEIVPEITHVLLLKDGRVLAEGRKDMVITSRNMTKAYNLKIKVEKKNKRYYARTSA